ncbi:MAG: immunoglobulin-like domain-containing protein, partial [Candidatus Thermoplasmatota archaeon]|nr:immunoglobulin-like domain-containing protein [Candidatus Thermoplasmatota archaeon]
AESNTDGSLSLYTFEARESPSSPTVNADDGLAILTMTRGEPTSWSVLSVQLSVNGAASVACAVPGQTNGNCVVVDSSNDLSSWTSGEEVTVFENGVDLCSDENCEMTFSISNLRTGQSLAKTSTGATTDATSGGYTTPTDTDENDDTSGDSSQGGDNSDQGTDDNSNSDQCTASSECMQGGYCMNGVCVYNDQDIDGIADEQDNCPQNANADQADADQDGTGDACDATPYGPMTTYYADADGDTYGDANQLTDAYTQPAGYVTNSDDCNDQDASLNLLNSLGNCAPEPATYTYYRDADGDTYGDITQTTQATSQPAGYVTNSDDCDDTDSTLNLLNSNGDCAPEPTYTVVGLDQTSGVNIVGGNYVFNDGVTYDPYLQYGLGTGTFVLTGIPTNHPFAILNYGSSDIQYTGDSTTQSTDIVDGVTYDFFYGDVTITVTGNFGTVSVYCPYHGYMGGENLFVYDSQYDIADTTPPVITVLGNNPVTIEVGSTYTDAGATADGGEIVTSSGTVDTNTVGAYTITYSATDSSGNQGTATRTVYVVDTNAPVITVLGDNPATVELGSTYTDAGATADGGETVTTSGTVDTNTVGVYTITYTATDSSGNQGIATRTVNVVDTTAPVITVLGNNPETVEVGSTYTDAGATADGGETVTASGTVDTNTVGVYTITYTATDSSNNAATATRTVNVVDTTAPVMTLVGSNPVNVEAATTYTDAGATAQDNYDGDITSSITTTNNIDMNTVGTYSVIYNVADANGNSAVPLIRTVNVVDTTAPVITIIGSNPVDIQVGSVYSDAGATAADTLDGDLSSSITVVNNVDANTVGTYTVTYDVTDSAGNQATQAVRTVNVNSAPNTPPSVDSVSLSTSSNDGLVYSDVTLTCSSTVSDADGDAVTTSTTWTADGNQIGTGSSITLTTTLVDIGDSVFCTVTPNDGTTDGSSVSSTAVTVSNYAPTINSVTIDNTSPTVGDTLTCSATSSDAEGHSLTTTYTWYVNSVEQSPTSPTFDTTGLSDNDVIYCSARVEDTYGAAAVQQSSTVTVTASSGPTTHYIDIVNFAFSPSSITINVGDTIIWTNLDSSSHTVTSDDGIFNSGGISKDNTWSYTFTSAGTFGYHCSPHPGMTGTVIVQ